MFGVINYTDLELLAKILSNKKLKKIKNERKNNFKNKDE